MEFVGHPIVVAVLCWAILLALIYWLGALNFLWTSGTSRSFNYLVGYQPALQGPDFQVQITVALP